MGISVRLLLQHLRKKSYEETFVGDRLFMSRPYVIEDALCCDKLIVRTMLNDSLIAA